MWEWTEHDRTVDLGTEDLRANRIREILQVRHTTQLQLDLKEIIAILYLCFTINEAKHRRREHFFGIVLVVKGAGWFFHFY